MKMFCAAQIAKAVANVQYGVAVDRDFITKMMENELTDKLVDKSGLGIRKFSYPGTCLPMLSLAKEFDAEKPAFIGFKVSDDGQYLNATVGNTEPKSDLADPKVVGATVAKAFCDLFTTSFNADGFDTDADGVKTFKAPKRVQTAAIKAFQTLKK